MDILLHYSTPAARLASQQQKEQPPDARYDKEAGKLLRKALFADSILLYLMKPTCLAISS